MTSTPLDRRGRYLGWLVLAAFVARVVLRLRGGEADFLTNSYSFYLGLADHLAHGQGFCLAPHEACALRVPVYPMFLWPFLARGWLYPGVVLAQAALGAAMVWLAWKIGTDLFDSRTGWLAAVLAAFSPYALIHDTAVQDTVLANGLMALAIYLLLRTRQRGAPAACLGAGLALGFAVLTTARLALVLPAAVAWALVGAGPAWRVRLRSAVLIALPVALLVGGWVARNGRVVGAPVLTTESGESLWVGNNDWTLAHFPAESIDLSVADSYQRMTPAAAAAFAQVSGDEVVRDRLLGAWGVEYMRAHPAVTLRNGLFKIWVAVSAQLSPARGAAQQFGYALVFAPVHLLAAIGLWRARRAWRVHALAGVVLLSFAITTAVFWAHTSHKSYLDLLLFVYAASVISQQAVRLPRKEPRDARG
jgi:4-amino-4-deoxy-L-arabinose transferase-like glycosyltransferase